jgi:hypothetical protein
MITPLLNHGSVSLSRERTPNEGSEGENEESVGKDDTFLGHREDQVKSPGNTVDVKPITRGQRYSRCPGRAPRSTRLS